MDAPEEPVTIVAGGVLIPIEQATPEQLIEAIINLRASNSFVRRRLESLHIEIRRACSISLNRWPRRCASSQRSAPFSGARLRRPR